MRENIEYFPEQFRLAILSTREKQSAQPSLQFANDFVANQDDLLQEGEYVNVTRYSTSVKTFLSIAMEETSIFEESLKLAAMVKSLSQDKGLSKATMVHHLSTLSKFIDYLTLHRFRDFPLIREIRWNKVIKEIRIPYQKNSNREKRVVQEKFLKVPTFKEVKKLNSRICSALGEDTKKKHLSYRVLQVLNFFILSTFELSFGANSLFELGRC